MSFTITQFNSGQPSIITDGYGNDVAITNTTLTGSEYGLVVRAIGSGTFTVGGTVTANIGTSGSLALDATLAKLTVAQGSALGSNTQAMVGGSVTTAAPTYTTGNINPLSLTTAGALRIDGSNTTQPISGTITANAGTGTFTVAGTVTSNIGTTGGLALDATLTGGTVRTKITDGSNNAAVMNSNPVGTEYGLIVRLAGGSSGGTNSSFTSAFPSTGTAAGFNDGTNMQAARVFDVDTGAGTQYVLGANLRLSSNGGSVEAGTATNPLRTDPTGTTTQPVSGTVTANAGTGTFTVSGTVTANIGTSGSLALDATLAKLTIAQGTAIGSNTQALVGGSVTTAAPTYTTGQISPLSLTTAGLLRVDASGTVQAVSQSGTWTVQPGNTANTTPWLTTISQGGNSATVKAASTAAVATDPALVVAISPNNSITTTNASVSATGAAPPASASYIGGSVTTAAPTYTTGQMNALSLTTAGALRTDSSAITQPVSGTITANAGTGTFTVSGTVTSNIGTSGSLALDATLAKLTIAQGTALGTNTQAMAGGSVTTAAPTYTTGQISPLSLTTGGALRTDASGTTQPVSGTVTANQGGTWTVQPGNTANTTAWLVADSLAQGSTTSGQRGSLQLGAVTTAAPTYTTAQSSPLSLTTSGLLRVDGSSATQPVSGTVTANIGTSGSLALDATLAKLTISQGTALGTNTQAMVGGSVTTAAPTYTTGQISPLSLTTAGALRTDNSSWLGSTAPTVGSKTSANSIPVVVASDQGAIPVSQSGTWTVQPGNTANTTPWLSTINQGGNSVVVTNTDVVGNEYGLVVRTVDQVQATFSAVATSVVLGNNKSMISITNATGSSVVVRIREIWLENVQTTTLTGVVAAFELRRFVSHASGTSITPVAYDNNDSLNGSVTTRTGATITTETGLLMRRTWSSDDWGPGTLDLEGADHQIQASTPFWSRNDLESKLIVLRANEGVHVKCATNTTAGTFDFTIVFTQAAA